MAAAEKMNPVRKYVLWLPLWYPNRMEPLSGDFIQRHAAAVATLFPVKVIAMFRDKSLQKGQVTISKKISNNLEEWIIYYNSGNFKIRIADRFFSFIRYTQLFLQQIRALLREQGDPDLVHLHIYGKNCFIGFLLKILKGYPLAYMEQSTRFLSEEAADKFGRNGIDKFLLRMFSKQVAASGFVSRYLADKVNRFASFYPFLVLPNVVDTKQFTISPKHDSPVQFVHVSLLDERKNISMILEAAAILKNQNENFRLILIGPVSEKVRHTVKRLELVSLVQLTGELDHPSVARRIGESHALILFSKAETFGCVIVEANACGVPVIVNDNPVMREVVEEEVTGFFASEETAASLATVMTEFIKNPYPLDQIKVRNHTIQRYGIDVVALRFRDLYDLVLGGKSS
jgi:glycosyltransferase involved in cell wall biosynthesis